MVSLSFSILYKMFSFFQPTREEREKQTVSERVQVAWKNHLESFVFFVEKCAAAHWENQ